MLLQSFHHHRPRSLDEALELMDRHGEDAAYYAGGTELLLAMKARVLRYDNLIDLKRLDELRGVQATASEVVIGALSSHLALAGDPIIRSTLPTYAQLSDNIANIRVRAQGTLGGNLCFAEPHADPPTMLSALGASLRLQGRAGERLIAMQDFISGEFTTQRAPDEILCEIRVPRPAAGSRFAYRSFGHLERPAVSVAVGYLPREASHSYKIFAGALTSTPVELSGLTERLLGIDPTELSDAVTPHVEEAVGALHTEGDLLGSADYKRHLAGVMLRRACADIVGARPELQS